jgi:hypothetical protein
MAGLCGATVPEGFADGLARFWSRVRLGEGRFAYTVDPGAERRSLAPVGMLVGHLVAPDVAAEQHAVWRRTLESSRGRPSLYTLYYGVRVLLALDGKLPKTWRDRVFELASEQSRKGPAAGSFPVKGRYRLRSGEVTGNTAFSVLTLEHSLYRR